MGEKLSGFAKENYGYQVRMVRGEHSEPLNIHLVWGSVWERNCKDLQREMMDFKKKKRREGERRGGGEEHGSCSKTRTHTSESGGKKEECVTVGEPPPPS